MFSHAKTLSQGNAVGTNTIWFGATTSTVAATDLVGPDNWESAHKYAFTLSGNTNNASTVSGTNLIFQGAGPITMIGSTDTNGASIIFSNQSAPELSRKIFPYSAAEFGASFKSGTPGTVSMGYFSLSNNLRASAMRIVASISVITRTNETVTNGFTVNFGLYTVINSTFSQVSSGSQSATFAVDSNNSTDMQGVHEMSAPIDVFATPGEYWLGMLIARNGTRSNGSTTGTGVQFSVLVATGDTNQAVTQWPQFNSPGGVAADIAAVMGFIGTTALPVTFLAGAVDNNVPRMSNANVIVDCFNYGVF